MDHHCNSNYLSTIRSQIASNNWTVENGVSSGNYKVDYCLAEKAPQYCKLQYSFLLTMTVIAFNIVKSIILLYMWIGIPDAPILTVGDAIASFLRRVDPYTQGGCLIAYHYVEYVHRVLGSLKNRTQHDPEPFCKEQRLWGSAVSSRRWRIIIIM
jgi:hypothetical protein